MPGPGLEPGTHWWEASAFTTVPTLLQIIKCTCITFLVHTEYSWELRCSLRKIHYHSFGRFCSVDTQPHPHPMKFQFSFILSYKWFSLEAMWTHVVVIHGRTEIQNREAFSLVYETIWVKSVRNRVASWIVLFEEHIHGIFRFILTIHKITVKLKKPENNTLQAVKVTKSGHHLLYDWASKGYGSIPGLTSQTSLHACLQITTMQISLWHQPRNKPIPLTCSVVQQMMATFRNFYSL